MALLHPCVGQSTLPVSGQFKRSGSNQQWIDSPCVCTRACMSHSCALHCCRLNPFYQRPVWQQSLAHRACGCRRRLSRFQVNVLGVCAVLMQCCKSFTMLIGLLQLKVRAARQRNSNTSPKRSAPEHNRLQRQQQIQHTSDETGSQTTGALLTLQTILRCCLHSLLTSIHTLTRMLVKAQRPC